MIPVTLGFLTRVSTRNGAFQFEYSGLILLIWCISFRNSSASSSRNRIDRFGPYPSKDLAVVPGHTMMMLSPIPYIVVIIWRWNPFPKASNTSMATVPQTIPKIVRKVRSL
jgi:hypothetical protein